MLGNLEGRCHHQRGNWSLSKVLQIFFFKKKIVGFHFFHELGKETSHFNYEKYCHYKIHYNIPIFLLYN